MPLGPASLLAAKKQSATPSDDWPEITPEEKRLNRVSQDPEADAVVLLNARHGKIVTKGADTVNMLTYHWRLKVLTDRGKHFGEVRIPAQKYSRVSNIRARTVKSDGTVVPVAPDQIFQKVVREVGGFKWTAWVFNFPAVEPGAILEYRYDRHDNNLLFIEPWNFEGEEFTLRSVMSQAIPGDMGYSLLRQNCGETQPQVTDWREGKSRGKLYTLELRDLPGYRDEILMPPRREVSPRLEMVLQAWVGRYSAELGRQDRLFIDWPSVAQFAWYGYQQAAKKGESALKSQVDGWVQGTTDPERRFREVVRHVRQDFEYVPWASVIGSSRTLEGLIKDKSADNEEKAVLLKAALKAIGVESDLALVSGKDGGPLNPNFFSLSQFTHALVVVTRADGTKQWIDPTVTTAPFQFTPWKDSGAGALLLKGGKGEIVQLPMKNELSLARYEVGVKPRADGKADLEVEAEYEGEDAIDMREDLLPAAETVRKSFLQQWVAERLPGAALASYALSDLQDVEKPLRLKMTIESPGLVTLADEAMLVRGCALTCEASNPITRGGRQHPFYVDEGWNEQETVVIRHPEGTQGGQTAPAATAQSMIGSFTFSCSAEEQGAIRCSRQFLGRRGRYPAGAQTGIRAMYDQIVTADRSAVAFQKGAQGE